MLSSGIRWITPITVLGTSEVILFSSSIAINLGVMVRNANRQRKALVLYNLKYKNIKNRFIASSFLCLTALQLLMSAHGLIGEMPKHEKGDIVDLMTKTRRSPLLRYDLTRMTRPPI